MVNGQDWSEDAKFVLDAIRRHQADIRSLYQRDDRNLKEVNLMRERFMKECGDINGKLNRFGGVLIGLTLAASLLSAISLLVQWSR